MVGIEQVKILDTKIYGSPKTQAIAQPPTYAPCLQFHNEIAAIEHLLAMCRTGHPASGLPFVRIL
jgi:hypothetical protein